MDDFLKISLYVDLNTGNFFENFFFNFNVHIADCYLTYCSQSQIKSFCQKYHDRNNRRKFFMNQRGQIIDSHFLSNISHKRTYYNIATIGEL